MSIDYNSILPSQVRRQLIFEGLVGKDLSPAEIENILVEAESEEPIGEIAQDTRLHTIKHRVIRKEPKYNHLYDSLRSQGAWRYTADNYATGTVTTIAAASVQSPVTLALPLNARTSQWPGAVQLYLCLRSFAFAPQAATFTTVGAVDVQYVDLSGYAVPLGDFLNNGGGSSNPLCIIPSPITDPGKSGIGNLVFLLNTGASVSAYYWQLGFSYAYLLPQDHPFDEIQQAPFEYVESNQHAVTFP